MMAFFSQICVCTLSLQACNYRAIRGKGKDFFKYLHVVIAYTVQRYTVLCLKEQDQFASIVVMIKVMGLYRLILCLHEWT